MSKQVAHTPQLDFEQLRKAIRQEYTEVALKPEQGFHFHSGAPQSSSAAAFGTLGINFRTRKPVDEQEWETAWAALTCEVPTSSPSSLGTTV